MGLDMFLTAENFLSVTTTKLKVVGIPKGDKTQSVRVEAVYWRKANQIHAWFVKNVQRGVDDCNEYAVTKDQLEILLHTCSKVLVDHSLAKELLPVQEGYFFGGNDYGDWYFSGLRYTVEMLDKALEAFDAKDGWYFIYRASW